MTRRRKIVLLSFGAFALAAATLFLIYRYSLPFDPVIGELRFSDHLLRAYTPFPWNRQNRPPNATEFKQHQTNLSLRASSRRALRKAGPKSSRSSRTGSPPTPPPGKATSKSASRLAGTISRA
jgi:hypothetical protein